MVDTVNERLLHEAIDHAVDLQQYSNTVVYKMVGLLNRSDVDLTVQLALALERVDRSSFTAERIETLLRAVRNINLVAYTQLMSNLTSEMRILAGMEGSYQANLFEAVLPETLEALTPLNTEQVYAAALSRPFQGRLLNEWVSGLESDRFTRLRDAVRIGFVENETTDQIVRRVRGTRAARYADGILQTDRRNAESVVRTAVSHTANFVRDRFYEANDSFIKAIVWVSTLDNRTSPLCQIRDGLEYTNNERHKPIDHAVPWGAGPGRLHWQCRSTSTPIVKSWRELGLEGDELPAGVRASMDGAVAEDTTYAQWLRKQSAARQDEILGSIRGKLYRQGELSFDAFFNDKGRYLTLDQLQTKHAARFAKAGV